VTVRLPFCRVAVADWHSEPQRAVLSEVDQARLWRLETAWWLHGSLPVEPDAVARLTGAPLAGLAELLEQFFPVTTGLPARTSLLLADARLDALTIYEKQAAAGRASARKRVPKKAGSNRRSA
jgi:hypothetical protein